MKASHWIVAVGLILAAPSYAEEAVPEGTGDAAEAGSDACCARLARGSEAVGSGCATCHSGATAGGGSRSAGQSADAAGCCAESGSSGCDHAAGGKTSADRRAGTELRPARDEAVGDAGTEDAETQQRESGQDQSHGVLDRGLGLKALGEFAKQGRADADNDGALI